MKYFKKLVGDNVYLSPRNSEDVEKFVEWLNNFDTTDYIGRSPQITTIEGETEWLKNHANDEAAFVIVRLEDDEMIGTVCLERISHIDRTGTLGIFIGDSDSRDKGYGTEAIRMLLEYGFKYLNLNNIKLDVMGFNDRAIACYKKCGFKEIGRRRNCRFVDGKYYDSLSMDILAEEFEGNYIRNKNV
jgi:RimJ/RimL family protein N-acetyltransferase